MYNKLHRALIRWETFTMNEAVKSLRWEETSNHHVRNAWQPVKCNRSVLCISQWWELPHCNHGEGQRDGKTFEKSAEEDEWNSDPRTRALMSAHFAVWHTQTHNTLLQLLRTHPSGDSMHLRSTAHSGRGERRAHGGWQYLVISRKLRRVERSSRRLICLWHWLQKKSSASSLRKLWKQSGIGAGALERREQKGGRGAGSGE